ncbi:MAG: hypothetical protein M1837_001835 [Sclerophora amabilis]|nr:MAG: hypothetical protein M1837_001835 [Sclerophora amabilis]
MSTSQRLIDIHNNLDVKNWSTDLIKTGLDIDQAAYVEIYRVLETEMSKRDILGTKLNTITTKDLLQQSFAAVTRRFPDVFGGIPQPWKVRCLKAIAQRCNYNDRRRLSRDEHLRPTQQSTNPPKDHPGMTNRVSDEPLHGGGGRLSSAAIYIQRAGGQKTIVCRIRDLVDSQKKTDVAVDDLSFETFVSILNEDVGFDGTQHVIFYRSIRGEDVEIVGGRSWKAALERMLLDDLDQLTFGLEMRPSGETTVDSVQIPTPDIEVESSDALSEPNPRSRDSPVLGPIPDRPKRTRPEGSDDDSSGREPQSKVSSTVLNATRINNPRYSQPVARRSARRASKRQKPVI